jgi:amino acid transporter
VLLLTTVVLSYRQLVRAYPTGGGDYEVATKNLGRRPASSSRARCWSTTC